ncbi:MAG: hypothetical protein WAP52_00225 [Candidatus Sungiibacteriota bacterium]
MQTRYDWRERRKTLMQTDIPNPPLRGDIILAGDPQEQMKTFRYLYDNGYLTGTAYADAEAFFGKEAAI